MSNNYRKTLLPTAWYHVTIRDSRIHNGGLRLTFTVDRGEYAYRNIVMMFDLTDNGLSKLAELFWGIGYVVITDTSTELFVNQFTNDKMRMKAKVDRFVKGSVVKNIIIELQPPEKPEDYNVLKPKTDKFYHKNNKGKDLPIQ